MAAKSSSLSTKVLLGCALLVAIALWSLWSDQKFEQLMNPAQVEYRRSSVSSSTTTLEASATAFAGPRCAGLGEEEEMDQLISRHEQIFITMPAKAAGKSLTAFVDQCTPSQGKWRVMLSGPIGHLTKKGVLTEDLRPPPLIAGWLIGGEKSELITLAQATTKKSLIIYIHREETSRLKSGIRHFVENRRKRKNWDDGIPEEELLDVIQSKPQEIGNSGPSILTCEAYEAIEDNAPNLVFLHYLQVDRLLKLLAKHHCPEQGTVHDNKGSDKKPIPVFLKNGEGNNNSTAMVYMDDWLDAKTHLLEVGLGMRDTASCQAKTKKMEADLFSCPDETLHFSSATFFRSAE